MRYPSGWISSMAIMTTTGGKKRYGISGVSPKEAGVVQRVSRSAFWRRLDSPTIMVIANSLRLYRRRRGRISSKSIAPVLMPPVNSLVLFSGDRIGARAAWQSYKQKFHGRTVSIDRSIVVVNIASGDIERQTDGQCHSAILIEVEASSLYRRSNANLSE